MRQLSLPETDSRTHRDITATSRRPGAVLLQSGKIALLLRLLCAFPVLLSWRSDRAPVVEVVLVLVTTVLSGVLIIWWSRVVPFLLRHPAVVLVDIIASLALLALQGPDSPFVAYMFSSALLIGMLYAYPGRELLSALLITGLTATVFLDRLADPTRSDGPVEVSLVGSIVVIVIAVVIGSSLRTLQSQVDASLMVAQQSARDAALGEERSRLARELHDSLVKTLVGIGLQAKALAMTQPGAQPTARSISEAAADAVAESRRILTNLRTDSTPSLNTLLQRTAEEIGVLHGVPVDVRLSHDLPFDEKHRHNICKVAEEALTNAALHSSTERIDLTTHVHSGVFELVVTDHGRGFAKHDRTRQAEGHFGLAGMEERAAQIGSSLAIRSRPRHGTTITLRHRIPEEVIDV